MNEKKWRTTLKNNKIYWFPIIFLVGLSLLALLAPLLPIDPNATDVAQMSTPPNTAHIFGTDEVGRDYFIRVVYGGRISLLVGILAMFASTLIGTFIGIVSGYFGGKIDSLLMRFVDILSSIPWLVLVIVLSVLLKPGLVTIIFVIGCFSWMNIARLIRAETLSVKEREYVIYAQFIGEKNSKIIMKHIFPAVLPTLIVAATGSISSAIMTESALSFLGVGIQPPTASWGSLLQNAQASLQNAPYMAILPGLFIILTVYSFNSLGNYLREITSVEG
ncbi:MAG: ABC transporter permease [Vagococcus sp.]|uniref:ABC transporter permease n=1 Tax=Vagococcus sp. TaxID=1933889 RepID=UPI002FC821D5